MKRTALTFAAILVLLSAGLFAATPAKWLNVHVVEAHDNTKVDVRLPLSLICSVLQNVKADHFTNGRIHFHGMKDGIDLKAIWQELRRSEPGELVKVDSDKEKVRVWRENGLLLVEVFEAGAKAGAPTVKVRIPESLVDLAFSKTTNEIDLKALAEGLAQIGSGDIVTVHEKGTDVRVWVD